MYELQFRLDGLPPMGANTRRHWREVHRDNRSWLGWVAEATYGKCPAHPLRLASVWLTRHSSVEPDWDNMVSSFKPILDALESLGIIENDKMSVIGQPFYAWKKAPPGRGFIEVAVRTPEPPQGLDCTEREG